MHIDEIQYTYKPCKLLLKKSIHENDICIFENSKPVKPKQNYLNLYVCELKHINNSLPLHKI